MSTLINNRALKEAQRQALLQATRIKTAYTRKQLTSWEDIPRYFQFQIPENFSKLEFTYGNISLFTRYWEQSYEARIHATLAEVDNKPRINVDKNVSRFGSVTLFPEQQGCYVAIRDHFAAGNRAAMQDGYTGSGKTFIASALVTEFKEALDTVYKLHPVIIFTPKGIAENWRRWLENFGLSHYLRRRKIYVFTDSSFSTMEGSMFVKEEEDMMTGETELKWNPLLVPDFVIIDECHRYVNPKTARSKSIRALLRAGVKKVLFMSATPMEKINDSLLFSLAINDTLPLVNQKITEENFGFFASLLDKEPHKPNRESMKRLRKVLSPWIFSIPYVKPKHKAINVVQLVDFRNEKDQSIYESAHDRYIQACRKAGKNTTFGRFEAFVALQNYRKTVEPLRSYWIADRAKENYTRGIATAVGTAYKETITNVAFDLIDKHGIDRKLISIVWGGKKDYKPSDLLTPQELEGLLRTGLDPVELAKNKPLKKKIITTLRYLQDKEEHSESVEEQATRHDKLKSLGLTGKQTDNVRQIEIDKFQSGESKFVLFTIASGGIGLSFDKDKPSLWQREGIFTPVFSGKEFQQLLGRLVRRASIADAIQRIAMMRNTVEEFHVAPILDVKLKCIAEITNRNFDIIELLQGSGTVEHKQFRNEDEANRDAENDNTIISDFVSKESEEEDEEEEDDNILEVV